VITLESIKGLRLNNRELIEAAIKLSERAQAMAKQNPDYVAAERRMAEKTEAIRKAVTRPA
jgi:hypothetical protein